MTYRLAKKRALEKAGLVHVAGWVKKDDAAKVEQLIAEAQAVAEKAVAESD